MRPLRYCSIFFGMAGREVTDMISTRELERRLRLDSDILDWFKAAGKDHLTRTNAVVRAPMSMRNGGRQRRSSLRRRGAPRKIVQDWRRPFRRFVFSAGLVIRS